jgi:predicted kinase
VWSIAKIMVDSLFGAGHAVVILDATNLHRKLREEWYGAVDRRVVLRSFVDVSPPDCMHRAILSERGDLVDVIARMEPDWRAFRNHEHEPATFIDNVADLVAST